MTIYYFSSSNASLGIGRASFLLLVALIILSTWLYWQTWWLPPSFHHVWAQSDWLALALNFRQRGFDFFHPATYNLLTRDGVTGAAFPLPAYLTALLMQLTGSEEPGVMRLLTLGISLGGLVTLFALVYHASRSFLRAGLVALFVFCSPIYGYYQANFLPSVPAFAAALAGYYCFYKFCRQTLTQPTIGWWLYSAVALLTIAAAIRTPFAIPLLVSFLHLYLLRPKQTVSGRVRIGVTYLTAALFLGGYFFYNEHLAHKYGGSMILSRPLPFHNLDEAYSTTILVANKWGPALLSSWQWVALLLVSLGAIMSRPWRFWRRSEWAAHWLVLAAGGGAYYLLMGPQYIDHDYYFIDSLLLPLVLLFAGSLAILPQPHGLWIRRATGLLAVTAVVVWANATQAEQALRYTASPTDRSAITLRNFTGSAHLLDSLGVPCTARIMVLDAYSFNLPLLLMQRRGWTVLTTSEENLRNSLQEPAELIVTQNAFFRSDIVNNYPLLLEQLDSVFSNGRLTLWRHRPGPLPVIWQFHTDLESPIDTTTCYNQHRSQERALSGSFSSHIAKDASYGLTIAKPALALGVRAGDRLVVHASCWLPTDGAYAARLVVTLEPIDGGPAYYWQALDCRRYQGPPGRWTVLGDVFRMPAVRAPTDLLKVYPMKEGGVDIWLDDLSLTLVR